MEWMASSLGGVAREGPGEAERVGSWSGGWRRRASRRLSCKGRGEESGAPHISQVEREGWFWNVQRGQEVEPWWVEDGALGEEDWGFPSL